MSDVHALCVPCGAEFQLVRQGVQVSSPTDLIRWLESHRVCRTRGEVIIRVEES